MNRRSFLVQMGAGLVAARARVVEKGVVYDRSPALIAGNCRCRNGDLLVAFNTGGDLSAGQRTGIVRSTDGGKSWGPPGVYFESVFTRGGIEAGCSLTCLSSGRLLLPYADGFYLHPGAKNNYDRHALLFCPTSDDNGRTWQNTKAQCYEGLEAFAFGTVVELPGGTLLLPLWGAYDQQGVWGAGLVKSKDGGKTWGDWRSIVREHGDETPIILLPDGRLLALIRGYTNDPERPFHVAHSSDGGDTWTAPQKVNLNGTSPSLHITPKGRLLAGYRSTLKGANCHVASSPDGGLHWTFELELELPRDTWNRGGYPAFENLPDGRIFVTFHNSRPSWYVAYNVLEEV
jgi:hypothetical protein